MFQNGCAGNAKQAPQTVCLQKIKLRQPMAATHIPFEKYTIVAQFCIEKYWGRKPRFFQKLPDWTA
jgi:hypothetical protein